MSRPLGQEPHLVDYLLGRMRPEQRAQIERRLFTDEDLNDELLATADDLIHAYLAGTLSGDDRLRFESDFLASPTHRRRLSFVQDMLAALERVPEEPLAAVAAPRSVRARWLIAAAAALAAVGALVALALLRGDGPRQALKTPPPSTAPSAAPPPPEPRRVERAELRRLRLPARSGAADLTLTPRTRAVRIEVAVGEDRPGFDAVVRNESGRAVWRTHTPPPAEPGEPLVLEVPAEVFASARYVLRIEGEAVRKTEQSAPLVLEYRLRVRRAP